MKVIMMMAITADGIIGRDRNHFPNWTCSADKKMFQNISKSSGVVIMGSQTYKTIGKSLPGRLNVVLTRQPDRFTPADDLWIYSGPIDGLVNELAQRGYRQAVLAGGGIINSLFLKVRCVDELLLTVSPKLFGQGLTLLSEAVDIDLKLLEMQRLNGDSVVLRYAVVYPSAH